MDFLLTLEKVSVLFLLIIVGYLVGKFNIISESGQKELTSLVLKVTMPATIILAMQLEYTKDRFNLALRIILLVVISYVIMIILSEIIYRFFKVTPGQKDIIKSGLILPNTSFMGYPIVLSILGKEALFYAVLGAGLIFEIVAWSYGIYTISKTTEFDFRKNLAKNILLSPGIVSIIIGFLLFVLSIRIPEPINTTMGLLSQATSPLAMILVGILLSRSNIKECITNYNLYLVAIIRLLVYPIIIYSIFTIFNISGMMLTIPVVMLAMPTAAYVAMFASNVGNDSNFASQIVFISSLLSLATIPLIVWLVQ